MSLDLVLDWVLGALPSVVLMVFFYLKDHYEPEPHGHVAAAFGLGALAFGLSWAASHGVARVVDPVWLAIGGYPARLFEAGVLAAGVEEASRFLMLFAVVYRWEEFDEPLDGLIYGVAVGLGLATVENVLYVHRLGLGDGLLRGVLSVPMHALCGAAMGAGFGRAKLGRGRNESGTLTPVQRRRALLLAFLLPLIFHTAYDFSLMTLRGAVMYGAAAALSLAMWAYVLRAVRGLQADSPFQGGKTP